MTVPLISPFFPISEQYSHSVYMQITSPCINIHRSKAPFLNLAKSLSDNVCFLCCKLTVFKVVKKYKDFVRQKEYSKNFFQFRKSNTEKFCPVEQNLPLKSRCITPSFPTPSSLSRMSSVIGWMDFQLILGGSMQLENSNFPGIIHLFFPHIKHVLNGDYK